MIMCYYWGLAIGHVYSHSVNTSCNAGLEDISESLGGMELRGMELSSVEDELDWADTGSNSEDEDEPEVNVLSNGESSDEERDTIMYDTYDGIPSDDDFLME